MNENRKYYSFYLLVCCCSVFLTSTIYGKDIWHFPEATFRFKIEKNQKTPWPTKMGKVILWPYDFNPVKCGYKVVDISGRTIGSYVLWAVEGEPVKLLFDTSGKQTTFFVYTGKKVKSYKGKWHPNAGIILETRKLKPGGSVNSWKETKQLWRASEPPLGRSLVPNIFDGIHRHGPTRNFLSCYRGFFETTVKGTYAFATLSDDASFLLIDKRLVVQWPGWHTIWSGRRGEHNGTIRLRSGSHSLVYYNAQDDKPEFRVAVAWKQPSEKFFRIMPANVFLPFADYVTTDFSSKLHLSIFAWFQWETTQHTLVEDTPLINVLFKIIRKKKGFTYHWSFDDKSKQIGASVVHLFLTPGMHEVKLDVRRKKKNIASRSIKINVQPRWIQRQEWPRKLFEQQKREALKRDFNRMPVKDLAALTRYALDMDDWDIISVAGGKCVERRKEMLPEYANLIYRLALALQHYRIQKYDLAHEAFKSVIALKKQLPQEEAAKLHYAGFLIHTQGKTKEAAKLINSIDVKKLTDTEKRLRILYLGDRLLIDGDIDGARKLYQTVDNSVVNHVEYSVRHRARLQSARDFIRRKEYDYAEHIIRLVEWENPIEKFNSETALMMVKVYQGRKEYRFAHFRCQQILNLGKNCIHRPMALLYLMEVYLSCGKKDKAQRIYRQLLKEYPYSESAAKAKEQIK